MTATIDPVLPNPAKTPAKTQVKAGRWLGLAAVLAAMIMDLLDSTVVNIGAPVIRADLGGSLTSMQWLAAGYTLALAVGLLTGGRLGDMYGRRRMMMIGLVGFVIASSACAVAWSPESLIGFRVGQGLFAALMVPQAFGLIRDLFPPAEIGKAFAALGPVIGLSTVAGPIIAGGLIDLDLFGTGWRALFLINLPLGIFALVAGMRALPRSEASKDHGGLDVTGALIAGAGMFLLVYPLVQGREKSWPVWIFVMLAAAVPVIALFVVQQLRRTRQGRTPLIQFGVLAKRSYTSGLVFVLVFFGALVGFSLSLGLFLQVGLGFSAMKASLFMAALAVGAFFGSGVGAAAVGKVGRPVLHLGLAVMAVGSLLLWLALDADPSFFRLAGPLFVFGLGMGMIFVPLFDIILGDVEDHEVGTASGLLESLQQLGASLGVAVLATVFFAHLPDSVEAVKVTTLLTLGLVAVAFAVGFLLPRAAAQR